MKTEYIQPFINAARKVLKTMAFTESTAKKPYLKEENLFKALGDISAIIELNGECKGSVGVSFSQDCILHIADKMLGEKFDDLNDDISDMVGEIVNMISGDARRELVHQGMIFTAGIPNMMKGDNHEIVHIVNERIVVIPFETDNGCFFIETSFDSEKFIH